MSALRPQSEHFDSSNTVQDRQQLVEPRLVQVNHAECSLGGSRIFLHHMECSSILVY